MPKKPNNYTKPAEAAKPTLAKSSAKEILAGYEEFLRDLKTRIRSAQIKAVIAVNSELTLLYWETGKDIQQRQKEQGWGAKIIDRLAHDLSREFPEMKGFSPRNLKYMRAFAEAYPDRQFVQQVAAQIPWFHNCVLLDKIKDPAEREWYARKTLENGWSRAVLDDLVKSPDDLPSIGIILCKGKNQVIAEYALRDVNTPIGVASYRLKRELPADLAKALPAPSELEKLLREE